MPIDPIYGQFTGSMEWVNVGQSMPINFIDPSAGWHVAYVPGSERHKVRRTIMTARYESWTRTASVEIPPLPPPSVYLAVLYRALPDFPSVRVPLPDVPWRPLFSGLLTLRDKHNFSEADSWQQQEGELPGGIVIDDGQYDIGNHSLFIEMQGGPAGDGIHDFPLFTGFIHLTAQVLLDPFGAVP